MKLNKKSYNNIEKVFINGVIYSIDKKDNIYEAMAINNENIVALGNNDEIMKYCTNETQVINLKSRIVLPGFISAHCYIPERMMMKKDELSLFNANNLMERLRLVQSYIDSHPEEKIIYGSGLRNSIFYGENLNIGKVFSKGPNKRWLKNIITDKPIVLKSCDGHALWLNDKAFEYFNITKHTEVPVGGKIELDECGELWGTLRENAVSLVNIDSIRKIKKRECLDDFIKYQKILHSRGVTTISLIDEKELNMPIEIYKKLEIGNKLKLRIVYGVTIKPQKICDKTIYEQIHELKRNRILYKTKLFDIAIAKFLVDGTIEDMTAYLFKPYGLVEDGYTEDNGMFLWEEKEFKEGIKMANRLDFNVCIHAVGDFACKLAIDGLEYSSKNNINQSYRNSLLDIDLITKYYMRRMKILNINAVIQPLWFYKDINSNTREVLAIGEERAQREHPIKSLISQGVVTAGALGNDDLYASDPLKAIECLTVRNLYDFIPSGYPKRIDMNDIRYRLNPDERISVIESIKMFTINAAYVLGMEDEIGSLEIGKKADFIILDKNIFTTKLLDISDISIEKTYFNGKLVYLNE
jgi:predicted amidohydrolase YtcJ